MSVLRGVLDAEPDKFAGVVDVKTAITVLDGLLGRMLIIPDHVVPARFEELPQAIRNDAEQQGSGPNNANGVLHCGVFYAVAGDRFSVGMTRPVTALPWADVVIDISTEEKAKNPAHSCRPDANGAK